MCDVNATMELDESVKLLKVVRTKLKYYECQLFILYGNFLKQIWLYENIRTTLMKVMNDAMFYKFGSVAKGINFKKCIFSRRNGK